MIAKLITHVVVGVIGGVGGSPKSLPEEFEDS